MHATLPPEHAATGAPLCGPQHASRRSPLRGPALPIGLAVTAIGVILSLTGGSLLPSEPAALPRPAAAEHVPSIDVGAAIADDPCSEVEVKRALAQGDDAAAIAAFGGGMKFREAVAAGNAPCISLSDPARIWVMVNKQHPLAPLDFAPPNLTAMSLPVTSTANTTRPDVAAAVGAMADAAAVSAGGGRLGANNGYRSYPLQVATYASHVRAEGQSKADAASARPGHSEHQTGLAIDVVTCNPGCGSIDGFGGTPLGAWVTENAWEYGFITRYEATGTPITGYEPEPWHLRYVGIELAAAYHAGGFHTLEEFFGLPAAPDYAH